MLGYNLKTDRINLCSFPRQPFNITVIKIYAPIINAEKTEVKWFYGSVIYIFFPKIKNFSNSEIHKPLELQIRDFR